MKNLIFGALAFAIATGMIVEKKFNVADRLLSAFSKKSNKQVVDADDEEKEQSEQNEV